jgi:hypothetical protein
MWETQPPTSLITSSSLSRQFSLADLLLLHTSRLLWLLFRLVTLSLRLLHLSVARLLVMAMLGMEMVSVKARVRRRNLCLAVFFSIVITGNKSRAHTWHTYKCQSNIIPIRISLCKENTACAPACAYTHHTLGCARSHAHLVTEAQCSHFVSYVVGAADRLGLSLGLCKHVHSINTQQGEKQRKNLTLTGIHKIIIPSDL